MMRIQVVQAPVPPASPKPGVTVVTPRVLTGAPATAQEVAQLKARRDALSDQLISATSRRHDVARQLQTATGADKAGLEQRMAVLDQRIARLESDIDETGQQLASAPVALVSRQSNNPEVWGPFSDNASPLLIVFTIFVLCPLALAWARAIWKRGSQPRQVVDRASMQRLERMEQAMDAISIEIERVSEGQRFVTRLMSEGRSGAALAGGESPMEPVSIPAGEKSRS